MGTNIPGKLMSCSAVTTLLPFRIRVFQYLDPPAAGISAEKPKNRRPREKNAETQQTLRHAETCFCEIPPISRRIPPISSCLFCTELDFEKNAAKETKNTANSKKAPFSKKAETSADLGGLYGFVSTYGDPKRHLFLLLVRL